MSSDWIMQPWLPTILAVFLVVLLALFLVASYWWLTRPSGDELEVRLGSDLRTLSALAAPFLIILGFCLMMFPLGPPEVLVLRSGATILAKGMPDRDPQDFDNALADLAVDTRIIDAGPVVTAARLILERDHPEIMHLSRAAQFGTETIEILSNTVERAVRDTAAPRIDVEGGLSAPDALSEDISALVEALELAVVETLLRKRNVKAVMIEVHDRLETSDADNPWKALRARMPLSENDVKTETVSDLGSRKPISFDIIRGSDRRASARALITQNPWLSGDNSVYVQVLVGQSDLSNERLSLVDATGRIIAIGCDSTPLALSVSPLPISNCVTSATVKVGTLLTLRLRMSEVDHEAISSTVDGQSLLRISSDLNNPFRVETVRNVAPVPLSAADTSHNKDRLTQTLSCLAAAAPTDQTLLYFNAIVTQGGRTGIRHDPSNPEAVRIFLEPPTERLKSGIWVVPESISEDEMAKLRDAVAPGPLIPMGDRLDVGGGAFGLTLFPMATQNDVLVQGVASLHNVVLNPRRSNYSSQDPSVDLLDIPSAIVRRLDATPVAFSFASRPNDPSDRELQMNAVAPLLWRIDMAPTVSRTKQALVWFLALDAEHQGMLLDTGCVRPDNKLVDHFFKPVPPAGSVTVHEAKFDEARFLPLWHTVFAAARETARVQTAREVPVPRDDATPLITTAQMLSRARISSAEQGMLLVLLGIMLHVVHALFLKLRIRKTFK